MTLAAAPLDVATDNVILVGNPNVGKSVLFKNLTSHYVIVANYPGTTVEFVKARSNVGGREFTVTDTPGLNDLEQPSEDARVTTDVLRSQDNTRIVQVADAKNLRRALLLTMQLAALKRPMVLVLNMYDELEERGGEIDIARLSDKLGIPVVVTVAPENRGTTDLVSALDRAAVPAGSWLEATDTNKRYGSNRARLARVNDILSEVYSLNPPTSASLSVKLGFWAMHPVYGAGFVIAALVWVFWFVGLFGAGTMVNLLEVGVFQHHVNPAAITAVDAMLPFPHVHATETLGVTVGFPLTPVNEIEVARLSRDVIVPAYTLGPAAAGPLAAFNRFVHDFLVGEFGLITMALSYAFAIVLPIVTTFFLVFSVLEDSGYFPRMSIMVNHVFRWMGLNGKAVLPMILGLGCDTMATMTTRILETRRERIVTTMLLALAVPCSAQLGVLLALMATLSPGAVLVWMGVLAVVVLLVGWLTRKLFNGRASDFILEIPPMRMPQLSNVAIKTVSRLNWYLKEVIPLFALGTAILFLLDRLKLLTVISHALEPLVVGWLGLPAQISNAFLIGFLRRDFGAVYILDAATGPDATMSGHQVLVAMITITLFIPCVANLLVIAREHGRKVALQMAAFIFPFAFLVGGLINHIGSWLFNI